MGKIPAGKVVLLVFYPPKGVAVNALRKTTGDCCGGEGGDFSDDS
ncbi:hypothetical protein ACPEF3_07290 [Klebsiella sp. K822]